MPLHAGTISNPLRQAEGDERYLRELDSAGWAWEWLRRNLDYRAFSTSPECRAGAGAQAVARWGLHFR